MSRLVQHKDNLVVGLEDELVEGGVKEASGMVMGDCQALLGYIITMLAVWSPHPLVPSGHPTPKHAGAPYSARKKYQQ